MSAVEDTREVREREERLLGEVASGVITRTLLADRPYVRRDDRGQHPLDAADRDTMADLLRNGLVNVHWPELVTLTDKGRTILGAGPDLGGLPTPPPLMCDSTVHEPRPAVVVMAETTGSFRHRAQCEECAATYALHAAQQALARFRLDRSIGHNPPPVAIHLIPLPQSGAP